MFINLYIARLTYRFILIYTCGLTAVIKRISYLMLRSDRLQGMAMRSETIEMIM